MVVSPCLYRHSSEGCQRPEERAGLRTEDSRLCLSTVCEQHENTFSRTPQWPSVLGFVLVKCEKYQSPSILFCGCLLNEAWTAPTSKEEAGQQSPPPTLPWDMAHSRRHGTAWGSRFLIFPDFFSLITKLTEK